jgi:hypothetical protein
MQENEPTIARKPDYSGQSLNLYHQNGRGSGSAVRLELRLNQRGEDRYNCFFLELAPQKTCAARLNGKMQPATFDWERKITVKLDFPDVCELLTVLEGKTARIGGERGGLYHQTPNANTLINFQKNEEQRTYYLGVSKKKDQDQAPQKLGITLTEVEATGLRCLFQVGLFYITFAGVLRRERREEATAAASDAGARRAAA